MINSVYTVVGRVCADKESVRRQDYVYIGFRGPRIYTGVPGDGQG